MTEQVEVKTAQNLSVAAAATYLQASVGHFQSLCILTEATAMLQRERKEAGQPELSPSTAAERATIAFEEALTASGKVSLKTVGNICRTMRKGAAFGIARMQKAATLYTLELSPELFAAEFETLEGFAPNLRDIDAAISSANGTARKSKKADKAEGSTEAANEAGEVKQAASVAERFAEALKTLAALAGDVENHAMIAASDECGDVVALLLKIRRETGAQEQEQKAA